MADNYTLRLKAYLDTAGVKGQIQQLSKSQKLTFTANGQQVLTTTKTMRDSMGKVHKSVQSVNQATGKASTSFSEMAASTTKVRQGFGDIIVKVGKFLAATTLISGFTAAISGSVAAVKELDDKLTEFKKVSDLKGTALENYTKKLGKLGEVSGRTTAEMVDAAT
jgi:methyl-accepting chemotaxis protein